MKVLILCLLPIILAGQDYYFYSAPINSATIGSNQVSHLSLGVLALECECKGLVYTVDIKATGLQIGLSKTNILHVPIGVGFKVGDLVFNAYVGIAFSYRTGIEYGARGIYLRRIKNQFYTFISADITNIPFLPNQKALNFGFAWKIKGVIIN